MNKYMSRYLNACKKCAKINDLIKKGYVVLDNENTELKTGFVFIAGIKPNIICKDTNLIVYVHDPELDDGYYTPIRKWNYELNQNFKVYKRKAIKI